MTLRAKSLGVILALGVAMVVTSSFVSTGYLSIDEAIYMMSADIFRDTGRLSFENWFEIYASDDLLWLDLLSVGPNGLTPQYPFGSAIVGGAFVGLFDEHGFYVMNALAAFATLFVTRALALELFDDERVALGAILLLVLASYFTEYAFGLWPHMVSILSVTTSFWLFLRAARQDSPLLMAILSGLALGGGLIFRLDGVLLIPAIGLLGVLYATRPVQVFVGGIIGVLPAITALAYTNALKFGAWNPISYGDNIGDDPLKYVWLIALSGVGFLLTVMVRALKLRPTRLWLVALIALIAGASLLVPEVGRLLQRTLKGIYVLIVDATKIVDNRGGVVPLDDGTLMFWGLPKKAMGQSLPWIGCLAVLIAAPWGNHKRAIACVLMFAGLWMFPFIIRSWHGGLSLNMRYFLPVLPALCALSCWALIEMMRTASQRVLFYTGIFGFIVALAWAAMHPTGIAGAHQILATYVFLAVVLSALIAGIFRDRTNHIAAVCAVFGIGYAVPLAMTDNLFAQETRSDRMFDFSKETGKDVIYDALARSVLRDPEQIFALPNFDSETADPKFVAAALRDGFRVLMQPNRASKFIETYPQFIVLDDVPIQGIPFQSVGVR